jgi:type IV secretory pathway VirB2 component (pilin)
VNYKHIPLIYLAAVVAILMVPELAYCSVESSLMAVQSKLITTILPLAAVLGLVFAGLSFVAGSANARNHLVLAIMGAVIGFGAPSIIQFIQQLVN